MANPNHWTALYGPVEHAPNTVVEVLLADGDDRLALWAITAAATGATTTGVVLHIGPDSIAGRIWQEAQIPAGTSRESTALRVLEPPDILYCTKNAGGGPVTLTIWGNRLSGI